MSRWSWSPPSGGWPDFDAAGKVKREETPGEHLIYVRTDAGETMCVMCGYKPLSAEWLFVDDPGCPCRPPVELTGLGGL